MEYSRNRMNQIFQATDQPPYIYLDSTRLIHEIKKHPVIYDLSIPRRNMFTIFAAWENINASLIPLYHFLNESDKVTIRRNLRKRWTWMRGLLTRDLVQHRLECHNRLNWMQEMRFLIPLVIERRKQMNKKKPIKRPRAAPPETPSTPTAAPLSNSTVTHQAIGELHDIVVQTFIALFTPNPLHSQSDPDKNFLFAVLQIFRKVQPERKEELKRKIGDLFPEPLA